MHTSNIEPGVVILKLTKAEISLAGGVRLPTAHVLTSGKFIVIQVGIGDGGITTRHDDDDDYGIEQRLQITKQTQGEAKCLVGSYYATRSPTSLLVEQQKILHRNL